MLGRHEVYISIIYAASAVLNIKTQARPTAVVVVLSRTTTGGTISLASDSDFAFHPDAHMKPQHSSAGAWPTHLASMSAFSRTA